MQISSEGSGVALLLSGLQWDLDPQAESKVSPCSALGIGTKGGDSHGGASSSVTGHGGCLGMVTAEAGRGAGRHCLPDRCWSRPAVRWQSCISTVFLPGREERLLGLGVQETSSASMSPDDPWSAAGQPPGAGSPQ